MKQILVISGKGGTGKTSITGCLAALAGNATIADCDVDAANLHLIVSAKQLSAEDFFSGFEAIVAKDNCTNCGLCMAMCQFDAIDVDEGTVTIDPLKCEGCGVCTDHCEAGTLELRDRLSGKLYISDSKYGPFVHAKLGAGGENSGKLVSEVRQRAKAIAEDSVKEIVLIDGPPGIGCPAIASIGGCDYAILVTEPSVSGLHDLKRIVDLLGHFKVPFGIVINKVDINEQQAAKTRQFAAERNTEILGELPYDNTFTQAQRVGVCALEHAPDSQLALTMNTIWNNVREQVYAS